MSSVRILGKFAKQPAEVIDVILDYTDWFAERDDAPASIAVTAEDGITLADDALIGNEARVVLSGGTDGTSYKVTVLLTTNASPAIVKEVDFTVRVKAV